MTMAQAQAAYSNRADAVGEIVTEATIDALNAALSDRGIEAERIISIVPVAAQSLVTVKGLQYRVLYRLQ
jgi:hypothetical protein